MLKASLLEINPQTGSSQHAGVVFQRNKNKIPLDWRWGTDSTSWRLCTKVSLTSREAEAEE